MLTGLSGLPAPSLKGRQSDVQKVQWSELRKKRLFFQQPLAGVLTLQQSRLWHQFLMLLSALCLQETLRMGVFISMSQNVSNPLRGKWLRAGDTAAWLLEDLGFEPRPPPPLQKQTKPPAAIQIAQIFSLLHSFLL